MKISIGVKCLGGCEITILPSNIMPTAVVENSSPRKCSTKVRGRWEDL